MKLRRLKINADFSSLWKGFEVNFRDPFQEDGVQDWEEFLPFCFAGLNGSGKSNVLEALANIFYHLESCANINQPQNFLDEFSPSEASPDAYELEYYILPRSEQTVDIHKMAFVLITKEIGKEPQMVVTNYPFHEDINKIEVPVIGDKTQKIVAGAKRYLPDLIIGYSSGENEVLSIPFLKTRLIHFDEYKADLVGGTEYNEPESKLIYIDYEMSQAVLLSNFIFQDKEVLAPLRDELKIKSIKRFRMNLNIHKEGKFNLLAQYDKKVTAFKNCATAFYEDEEHLFLDFWINSSTIEAFKNNFKDIFDLFQSFQILYTLNYRTIDEGIKSEVYKSKGYYTYGKLPIPSPGEKVFYFLNFYIEKQVDDDGTTKPLLLKNLSDGEQQFLHTLGICLMLKDKNTLLLLDEPETHFNPDWRSKFIRMLSKSLKASKNSNLRQEVLVTSHSPFIISDCFPDKVIIFQKGEQPVNAFDRNFRTYGTSIDIITENIFSNNNTIGDLAREEIEIIQEKIKNVDKLTEEQVLELKEGTSHLGDSMEKVMLFAQLNELKRE